MASLSHSLFCACGNFRDFLTKISLSWMLSFVGSRSLNLVELVL
jgi:hypothetical protein